MPGPPAGSLCYGDCLDWMARWDDATVDLIYLDPPFNSQASYNVLYARESAGGAQTRAFSDTWSWDAAAGERLERFEGAAARPAHRAVTALNGLLGPSGMLAYLTYMAERLEHMHRLLKPTGSLYLHCDPTASHYLKLLLDAIFGPGNFRSEVVWKRSHAHNSARKYGPIHDTILFYARSDRYVWTDTRQPYDAEYERRYFKFDDGDGRGRYWTGDLTGSGTRRGDTGQPWRGFDPTKKKRHWMVAPAQLDNLDADRRIYWPASSGAWPKLKRYLSEARGVPLQDLVCDIAGLSMMGGSRSERLGYPTQKPRALLRRLIAASSNEGDLILDPFAGCGTTVEAARDLRRQWCGVDISAFAVDLVKGRRLRDPTIPTPGIPADLAGARKLATEQPFAFESWAVTRLPGFAPNDVQRGDRGIDGRATLAVAPDDADTRLALAQVKGGRAFSVSHLRDFRHVMERERAALGCFMTLDPPPPRPRADAKTAGRVHVGGQPYDRLHLWSMADYFEGRWPMLPVMTDPYSGRPLDQPGLFA